MYAFLSEISNTLSSPFFQMVEGTKEFPLLAAVVLGIIGALAPCQLTGNIGAMTLYGTRSLETGQQWKEIASFILGKMTVFSGLGLVVLILGMEIQTILPDYFAVARKWIGPAMVLGGLMMAGIINPQRWFGKLNAGRRSGRRKTNSFMLGAGLSIAFCPTMFSLYFFTLLPLAFSTPIGPVLPAVFAAGTALPLVAAEGVIALMGWNGAFMKKSRRWGAFVQTGTGIVFIVIGLFDAALYWL